MTIDIIVVGDVKDRSSFQEQVIDVWILLLSFQRISQISNHISQRIKINPTIFYNE
jgi:hypothetical protein